MNEDHHPVGRPSGESGRAKIVPAELRERIRGTKIAIVLTKREATALLDRIEELEGALEPFVDTLNVSEESAVKDGRNPASVPDTFDVLAFRNVPGLKLAAFRRARKALSGEKQ